MGSDLVVEGFLEEVTLAPGLRPGGHLLENHEGDLPKGWAFQQADDYIPGNPKIL